MNKIIEEFIEKKEKQIAEKLERKKEQRMRAISKALVKEGVYDKEYAPIELVGYSHTEGDNKLLKFAIKDRKYTVGDTVNVLNDGEKIALKIERIEVIQNTEDPEYCYSTYDSELDFYHKYKKVPIKLTEEEYEKVKVYFDNDNSLSQNDDSENIFSNIGKKIKKLAEVLCWIGIISSIIAAMCMFVIAVDSYDAGGYVASGLAFLFLGPIVSWVDSFFVYGFGELIDKACDIEKNTRS